jgi:uncharacterized protein YlxW (UPF0749 family)
VSQIEESAPRSRPSGPASAQLLFELVNNTLDPGYAAAARRHGGPTRRRWYHQAAVAVGCGLIGFVLVVAYIRTHRSAPEAATVHDQLVGRVRDAQEQAADLDRRVRTTEQQLGEAQQQALPGDAALTERVARLELAAGQAIAHGPGLTVTLREPTRKTAAPSPGRGGTTSITASNILTDRDVRSVVDELWRDGAEAMAVNGIRLTPTSAVRFAGQAVLVDLQPIASPYRISAIGDSDSLATNFAQSAVASRYQALVSADGIGFTFAGSDRLTLPAAAPANLRYATATKAPR